MKEADDSFLRALTHKKEEVKEEKERKREMNRRRRKGEEGH